MSFCGAMDGGHSCVTTMGHSEEPPLGRRARDGREKVNAPVFSSAPASMSYPIVVADRLEKVGWVPHDV